MLFDPTRHEPLCPTPWSAERAHEVMAAIVRDTERQRLPAGHWPVHARDEDDSPLRTGFKGLYLGSAGIVWALWYLQREGAVRLETLDPAEAIQSAAAAYEAEPDTGECVPSYYLGEVGIALVQWRLTGGAAPVAERLHAAIRSNVPNPTNEALWAAPGTMVAAWHLWQATQEPRWRELFAENVDQLWRTWLHDEPLGCHLWTQDMYGRVVQYYGAGHGFVGNVYPLLKGAALLDATHREALFARCVAMLSATAHREGGAVNWPAGSFKPRVGTGMLVQWCHGAPGFITGLADFPRGRSTEMDAMLVAAGETVWQAGPLEKGHGLCHGTAGNGYAFLKLHQRTGEALWLGRARAFAMHAIEQCERMRQQHGLGRYSLWTGDLGLAVYLWHCIQAQAQLPGLDFIG